MPKVYTTSLMMLRGNRHTRIFLMETCIATEIPSQSAGVSLISGGWMGPGLLESPDFSLWPLWNLLWVSESSPVYLKYYINDFIYIVLYFLLEKLGKPWNGTTATEDSLTKAIKVTNVYSLWPISSLGIIMEIYIYVC